MNYEEMSDFEINKAVGISINKRIFTDFKSVYLDEDTEFEFDPCNNPSDAWPIIVEHGISVICTGTGAGVTYSATDGFWHHGGSIMDDNFEVECGGSPLRAAMICFLKMKDAECKN